MSYQGYEGEVNSQVVGHEVPGEEEGAQMMQLTQAQLAQIVSSAVSQALTKYVQHTVSNQPQAAATNAAAVQQVQSPMKFDVPVFEGDSAANWLTRSQRVVSRYFQDAHYIPIVGEGKRGGY